MRIVLVLLLSFLMLFVPPNAQAQSDSQAKPELRFNAQPKHSRLVFDWGSATSYKLQKLSKSKLRIKFDSAAKGWNGTIPTDDLVTSIKATSKEPLSVDIAIKSGAKVRDFALGGRIVIDVNGKRSSNKTITAAAPKPKTETKKPEQPKQTTHPDAVPVTAVEKQILPKQTILDKAVGANIKPHQINISSTKAIGLAAFWLKNQLWMITDRADLKQEPRVSGPHPELFKLESVPVEGGSGYKTTTPTYAKVHGSGGGVLWRVVVSDKGGEHDPLLLQRSEDKAGDPAILWPAGNAKQILKVPHPVTKRPILEIENTHDIIWHLRTVCELAFTKAHRGGGYDAFGEDGKTAGTGNHDAVQDFFDHKIIDFWNDSEADRRG